MKDVYVQEGRSSSWGICSFFSISYLLDDAVWLLYNISFLGGKVEVIEQTDLRSHLCLSDRAEIIALSWTDSITWALSEEVCFWRRNLLS